MKVETMQTATFYLTLAASELALIRERAWQELPMLSHDLILHPAPDFSPIHLPGDEPQAVASHEDPPQFLARIQLRANYLGSLDFRSDNNAGALELHVSPEEISNFNRSLVGPIVLLGEHFPWDLEGWCGRAGDQAACG